jgi:predicted transcriptional regulator
MYDHVPFLPDAICPIGRLVFHESLPFVIFRKIVFFLVKRDCSIKKERGD